MLLPGRNEARVPLSRLVEYLLSETHAVGRSKAKFFRGLGFNETNVAVLEQGLLSLAQMETIAKLLNHCLVPNTSLMSPRNTRRRSCQSADCLDH